MDHLARPALAWLLGLALLGGCATASAHDPTRADPTPTCDPDAPATDPSSCLGLGPQGAVPDGRDVPRNVDGAPLAPCGTDPVTGFYRDGLCRTGPLDRGVHSVCAEMTPGFLTFTKARGNDLSTPRPEAGFPGLVPGDRWCLCAERWAEAAANGVAPPVVLKATENATLLHVPRTVLDAHTRTAAPSSP